MENDKKTILIIEDAEFMQKILGEKLKSTYNIVFASNGEEGLAKARTFKPNLILLDLVMPKVNGFEFMERAQKEPEINTIPVIVQSALSSIDDIQKAMKLGAKNFFVKGNVSLDEMEDLISNHIK